LAQLTLHDHNGIVPDVDELVISQELLSYIDSGNKVLGTSEDPRREEYEAFKNSIELADIIKIDVSDLSSGKFDGLDLSGEDDDKPIEDIPDNKIFGLTFNDFMNLARFNDFTNYSFNKQPGEVIDKDYTALLPNNWQFPNFNKK
jgi:hypothetical protein